MENLFCIKHLYGLIWTSILIIILIYVSKLLVKKYDLKKVLKAGSLVLIFLEITKFIYIYLTSGTISLIYIPLQFCSLFLYAYPIIVFSSFKIKDYILPFAFVGGISAGLIALILPTNILGNPNTSWLDKENFMYTLSFIYHAFLIYYSSFLVISKYYKPKIIDFYKVVIVTIPFAVIAEILNKIFDLDLMLLNKGIGNPLQFILFNYGYVIYYVVMVLLLIVISIIILGITKIMMNIKNKKTIQLIVYIFVISFIGIVMYQKSSFPTIKLSGKEIVTVKVNEEYKDSGYSAYQFNKDISGFVNIENNVNTKKVGVYDVIYILKYYNDLITKTRKVKVVDEEKPIIKLKGSNEVNLLLGDTYLELGYNASDNYDGDITKLVNVTNNIENKIGKYEVTYVVSDSSGNITSTKRIINVTENNNGVIYLTFDDGPSNITSKVLDILKEENIKATFFLIGFDDSKNNIVKRIHNEGHTIALHSWSHNYRFVYSSTTAYYNDLNTLKDKIKSITGEEPKIIRFPGGSSNTVSYFNYKIMSTLTKEVLEKGYHYFDWNIDSGDAGNARNSYEVYNNVIYSLSKNGSNVVLMHDYNDNYKTLNALKDIIEWGKSNNYSFSNITYYTPMVTHLVRN